MRQFRIAYFLMMVGTVPWIAMLAWVVTILVFNKHGRPPAVFMLDPIGMVGLMLAVYTFALVFAGTGACWSFLITRRYPELGTKEVASLRATIGVVVGVPLLCIILGFLVKML